MTLPFRTGMVLLAPRFHAVVRCNQNRIELYSFATGLLTKSYCLSRPDFEGALKVELPGMAALAPNDHPHVLVVDTANTRIVEASLLTGVFIRSFGQDVLEASFGNLLCEGNTVVAHNSSNVQVFAYDTGTLIAWLSAYDFYRPSRFSTVEGLELDTSGQFLRDCTLSCVSIIPGRQPRRLCWVDSMKRHSLFRVPDLSFLEPNFTRFRTESTVVLASHSLRQACILLFCVGAV